MGINALDNLLYQDIVDIIKRPEPPDEYSSEFVYEAKLHTEIKDLGHVEGLILNDMLVHRDYVNFVSDYIEITLNCWLGTYVYDIYDFLENIEVTLYKTRQLKPGGREIVLEERYKAVYLLERNSSIHTSASVSRETLNTQPPITLTLQLLDRASEAVRLKTLQGSFGKDVNPTNYDMSVESFLKSIITTNLDYISIESKPAIDRFTIEEVDNKVPLKSITIPSGTRLVDLPNYIQNKSSGVYNSGLGCFIQRFGRTPEENNKLFSVYSLYNSDKYHRDSFKAIFYSPPTSSLSINDITYKSEDGILRAVVNNISSINDTKEALVMSQGSGFRRGVEAFSMMNRPVKITEDGPVFIREDVVTEVVFKERRDGVNYAPMQSLTSNPFNNSSPVMLKAGTLVGVGVTNLDIDFIYPSMPCKIVYEDNNGEELIELYGVIHKVASNYTQAFNNPLTNFSRPEVKLNNSVQITVFVMEIERYA